MVNPLRTTTDAAWNRATIPPKINLARGLTIPRAQRFHARTRFFFFSHGDYSYSNYATPHHTDCGGGSFNTTDETLQCQKHRHIESPTWSAYSNATVYSYNSAIYPTFSPHVKLKNSYRDTRMTYTTNVDAIRRRNPLLAHKIANRRVMTPKT